MAQAILRLTDNENGVGFTMEVDFGEAFVPDSNAHQMLTVLAESVLHSSNSFEKVEDTAPEAQVKEPSPIITTSGE